MEKLGYAVVLAALVGALLWMWWALGGEPSCSWDPPFFLSGTVFDCGAP